MICTAALFVLLRDLFCCAICTTARFTLKRDLYCCAICTVARFVLRDMYYCVICTKAWFALLRYLYYCAICTTARFVLLRNFYSSRVTNSRMKSAELSARMKWDRRKITGWSTFTKKTTKTTSKYLANDIELISHFRKEGGEMNSPGYGLLWVRWRTVSVYKLWEIYWLAENMLASKDDLCCVESVSVMDTV